MNDILGQLRVSDWVRIICVALTYGAIGLFNILWYVYCRHNRRFEADEAKLGIKDAADNDIRDDAIRKYGEEIADLKRNLTVLASELKQHIPSITIPNWPRR